MPDVVIYWWMPGQPAHAVFEEFIGPHLAKHNVWLPKTFLDHGFGQKCCCTQRPGVMPAEKVRRIRRDADTSSNLG